jgi:hypothetical protein
MEPITVLPHVLREMREQIQAQADRTESGQGYLGGVGGMNKPQRWNIKSWYQTVLTSRGGFVSPRTGYSTLSEANDAAVEASAEAGMPFTVLAVLGQVEAKPTEAEGIYIVRRS